METIKPQLKAVMESSQNKRRLGYCPSKRGTMTQTNCRGMEVCMRLKQIVYPITDLESVLWQLHAAPVGEDESKTDGSAAPVGEDESKTDGSTAPVGEDESKTDGSAAPVGEDESKMDGSTAPVGEDESKMDGSTAPVGEDESKTDGSTAPVGEDESKTDGSAAPGGDLNAAEKEEANGEVSVLLNEDGVKHDNGEGATEENSVL
ncbi:uncharacterized protein ACWYII_032401 isoform 2-T3 [Salvelinus alpinus]